MRKKLAFVVLGGCAIGLSFGALTYSQASSGFSADTVVALALPALVSAFVFVAYLAARTELNRTKGTVSELNAQLLRKEIELDHLSTLDELTGLYARRQFDEQARLEFERARRYTRPLSLILLEIDDLHALGERVGRLGRGYLLSQVSEIIRARLRVNDVGGRYASDTLALLLPDSAEAQAVAVADKIRGQVQVNSFMGEPYDKPVRLTLSIGIAMAPCDGIDSHEDLERAAEQALSSARGAGRDSLCVHGSREPIRAVRAHPDLPLAS
ncbi:MAG: GGDEF domain-containing protein [Chloroflexota bacterium]|nr:GGDEF domain-containing protein [Chloroflexota bacterium]